MANLTIGGLTAAIAGDLVAGAKVELENAASTASLKMTLAQLRTGLLGTAYTATDDLTIRNITATGVLLLPAGLSVQFGGATNLFPSLRRTTTILEARLADDTAFSPFRASIYYFGVGSQITESGDGILRLQDSTASSFGRLQLGGTTSAFPALRRTGTAVEAVLADVSAYAPMNAASFTAFVAAPTVSAGQIAYGGTVATTVGAAGAGSALPATPVGYVIINVAGTQMKIPYFNN